MAIIFRIQLKTNWKALMGSYCIRTVVKLEIQVIQSMNLGTKRQFCSERMKQLMRINATKPWFSSTKAPLKIHLYQVFSICHRFQPSGEYRQRKQSW